MLLISKGMADEDGDPNANTDALDILEDLFSEHPASLCKTASQEYRVMHGIELNQPALAYSEVPLGPFLDLLDRLKSVYGIYEHDTRLEKGGNFVDLGAGVGKAVFAAALCASHTFDRVTGVEVVEPLYHMSLELLAEWKDDFVPALEPEQQAVEVQLLQGDLLLTDWGEAHVVFANSTTFDHETMLKLSDYAMDMTKGTLFLTASKPLLASDGVPIDESYELLEVFQMPVAFGTLSIYIQRKLNSY